MIGACDVGMNVCADNTVGYTLRHNEIIDTPAHILLAGAATVAPPAVGILPVRMKMPERIDEAGIEKAAETLALAVGEAGIVAVGAPHSYRRILSPVSRHRVF